MFKRLLILLLVVFFTIPSFVLAKKPNDPNVKQWAYEDIGAYSAWDYVIGSREVAGALREKEPLYRHLMGRGFNFGIRLLTVRGIADTQCGFKAFEAKAAKKLFKSLKVYRPTKINSAFTGAFDVELLFLARKFGYKIAEVPIYWKHMETDRVSPLRDSVLMALDVLKIRVYDLLGLYGKK